MAARTAGPLRRPAIVPDDAIAGDEFGHQDAIDRGSEGVAVDRPTAHERRGDSGRAPAATKVVGFPWPWGTVARS